MCGIAGICQRRGARIVPEQIGQMVASLDHRGPDEKGLYIDDHVGLGHARLSIVDLSGGIQPIHNEERTLWIVYNGEIYNYLELREGLEENHRFSTETDTEVILHLYEDKGTDCLQELNGQFAFAIWDSRKQELFLARDRCGIRPLHYTLTDQAFYFTSEIKALFTQPEIKRALDPIALDQIFTFWTTLTPRTAFEGIYELPPGHFLRLTQEDVMIRPYWQIPLTRKDQVSHEDITSLTEQMGDLLHDAIRLRLRADVPVGSYLSGGLDSSGLTCMVAQRFNRDVKTYGIRFEQGEFDEGCFQNEMAQFLGCHHQEVLVNNAHIGQAFAETIWHTERPLLRTSPVPLRHLSRLVHDDGLKVVLSGEGADEVFGGYNIFREAKLRRFWSKQPDSELRSSLLPRLYPYIFRDERLRASMVRFFGQGLDLVSHPLFSHLIRWTTTAKLKRFFSRELKAAIGDYNALADLQESLPQPFAQAHSLSQTQFLEMSVFLSNYLLSSQGDRMAMANSVEIRLPYLDHRLIEFMARVPAKWKILGLNEKHLLKRFYRDLLPPTITNRSKHPYRAPIQQSLLNATNDYSKELLSPQSIGDLGGFDPPKVKILVDKLSQSRASNEMDNMALAGILSCQLLAHQFVCHNTFTTQRSLGKFHRVIDRRTISKNVKRGS